MKTTNQEGFGVVEALLIILIVGIIGFASWIVYSSQIKTSNSLDNANKTNNAQAVKPGLSKDESANWLLYEPPGKEYKMRVPDGWGLTSFDKGYVLHTFDTHNIVYKQGTKAVITPSEGGKDYTSIPFILVYNDTYSYDHRKERTSQELSFMTGQGINVEKYIFTQTNDPEGLDIPKNTKEYSYFVKKGSQVISFRHDILTGEIDQSKYIEKAIMTHELP